MIGLADSHYLVNQFLLIFFHSTSEFNNWLWAKWDVNEINGKSNEFCGNLWGNLIKSWIHGQKFWIFSAKNFERKFKKCHNKENLGGKLQICRNDPTRNLRFQLKSQNPSKNLPLNSNIHSKLVTKITHHFKCKLHNTRNTAWQSKNR